MRLFVAVPLPTAAVEDLAAYLEPRREAGAGLRWADADQWHLTLAFMPDVPAHRVEDLVGTLGESLADLAGPALRLAGGGCFPDVSRAKVLWVGVGDPDGGLPALARRARGACARVGAAPGGGPFRPHLTLARFPRASEATRWVRVLDAYAGPGWSACEVVLVESHLGQGRGGRPRHVEVDRFPLSG